MSLPENAEPTPEQWLAWFRTLTPEQQLVMAERVMRNARDAYQCVLRDHDGLVERERCIRIDAWQHPEDNATAYVSVLRGGIVKITEPLLAGLMERAGWSRKVAE